MSSFNVPKLIPKYWITKQLSHFFFFFFFFYDRLELWPSICYLALTKGFNLIDASKQQTKSQHWNEQRWILNSKTNTKTLEQQKSNSRNNLIIKPQPTSLKFRPEPSLSLVSDVLIIFFFSGSTMSPVYIVLFLLPLSLAEKGTYRTHGKNKSQLFFCASPAVWSAPLFFTT